MVLYFSKCTRYHELLKHPVFYGPTRSVYEYESDFTKVSWAPKPGAQPLICCVIMFSNIVFHKVVCWLVVTMGFSFHPKIAVVVYCLKSYDKPCHALATQPQKRHAYRDIWHLAVCHWTSLCLVNVLANI